MNVSFDEKKIDAVLQQAEQSHLPGAAIGIAIGGIPVYRQAFGAASIEPPSTLTPQTRMRIYSITKHFTCLAYLLACEEGRAGIDDPISKHLPELHPATHRVTTRQLMSNTSGLRDACDIRWVFSGIDSSVRASDLLSLYRSVSTVNFEPETDWCYNNGGFHILSAIIEKIFGAPLEDVFLHKLFEPVGMLDTFLKRGNGDFVPNSAGVHMLNNKGVFENKCLPPELLGEGGLLSTVDDMLRWMKNMRNPVVGTKRTWDVMCTAHMLRNGRDTGYGCGLFLRPYRGVRAIAHSGGGLGGNSHMVRLPEQDLDVVVIANRDDLKAPELAGEILDLCLGVRPERLRRSANRGIAGLFRSSSTGRIVHLQENHEHLVATVDGIEEELDGSTNDGVLRLHPHSFWDLTLKYKDECGSPRLVSYEYFGCKDELTAVAAKPTLGAEIIAGRYQAEDIGAKIIVDADDDGQFLIAVGQFGSVKYRLTPLGWGIWTATRSDTSVWAAIVSAVSDDVNVLMLRTTRTWHVEFRRAP